MMVAAFLPFVINPITLPPSERRRYDCERLSVAEARASQPGQLPPEKPRGSYVDRSLLYCQARILAPGVRSGLDDVLLHALEDRATSLAEAAARWATLGDRTWLVEVNVPTAEMGPKIGFALKTALMRLGLSVSDRAPTMSAGDVDVITRMDPMQAYPAACRRFSDNGSLRDSDVLVYAMILDPRETELHAGLCLNGGWAWLR
jgi:hypothetical protein